MSAPVVGSDPPLRPGLSASVQAMPWPTLDANVALTRFAFVANEGSIGALARAPHLTGGGGVTASRGPSFLSLRARHQRPAG